MVLFSDGTGLPAVTTTATDGTYSLSLADGEYTRRVQAPGYTLLQSNVSASGIMTSNAALTAVTDAPTPLPTFGLPVQNASLVADPAATGVYYASSGFANTLYRTFDRGDTWTAVTRVTEDSRGIDGTMQGFQRPPIATSGVAGEVATVTLAPSGTTGAVWASADYGTTWTNVALPTGRTSEPTGGAELRWAHLPSGASFLVMQPAFWAPTLWVADVSAPAPQFTEIAAGVNPLAITTAAKWDVWNLNGTPALASISTDGSHIDVFTWTDATDVTSLARLGNAITLSPTVPNAAFFDVGGVNGNVMVFGGLDMTQPYPWPQTFGLIAKPTGDANFDSAFVDTQSVPMGTCYLSGTGIVAPTASYEDARALVGVSACPVHADPDGDQSVTVGGATGAIMPAYDGEWDGSTNRTVLGIAGRGIWRATTESGDPAGPAFSSNDLVTGITAPIVRSTSFGPAGSSQLAMTLDSSAGKRVIASDDGGATFTSVVDAGGWASSWWQGATGTWLVAGHSGAETGLLTAVADWTSATPKLTFPNVASATQANFGPPGYNSDVRAVLGVEGTDTLFAGTFQYPGYNGALYRGSLATGDFTDRVAITSSDASHPLTTVQDLAYCPGGGSATSVADTLFVATGYLGLVDGGIYKVSNALNGATPVATPVPGFPFAARTVTDVVVDCETGSLTVGTDSAPGIFHSSDGGATFDDVELPDSGNNAWGDGMYLAAAIDANPENPDQMVIVANESGDSNASGFVFATTDGGETWTTVADPSAEDENGNSTTENTSVTDIAFPPEAPPEPPQQVAAMRYALPAATITPSAVSLAPLAVGSKAGGSARVLDVGSRRSFPGAATATAAAGGNARARVQWNEPAQLGSRAITGYTATCSAIGKPTRSASAANSARQVDVRELARGTQYSCKVRAQSGLWDGPWSNTLTTTTFDVPSAPRTVTATAQSKALKLTFRAPARNGGTAITKYKAVCSAPGKPARTVERSATTITVSGLAAKTKYSCWVQAANVVGYGPLTAAVRVTTR